MKSVWFLSSRDGLVNQNKNKIYSKYNFNAKVAALNTAFKDLWSYTWKDFYFQFFPLLQPASVSTFKFTGIVTGRYYSYVFPPYQL